MNCVEQNCCIDHEGKHFCAGGAIVTDKHLVAYPDKLNQLKDWHGNTIGTWTIVSSRPAIFFGYQSWQGSRYYFMHARLTDGRMYSLRGFGVGMMAKGKRVQL